MSVTFVLVTVLTILANAGVAVADFVRAPSVLANSAEVGVPESWIPVLGALKAAGAIGLAVGLLGVPVLGLLAAIGLVLFFVGAVIAHLRARVLHNIAAPLVFLGLAVATVLLWLANGE
jgi:hypothetical protein